MPRIDNAKHQQAAVKHLELADPKTQDLILTSCNHLHAVNSLLAHLLTFAVEMQQHLQQHGQVVQESRDL